MSPPTALSGFKAMPDESRGAYFGAASDVVEAGRVAGVIGEMV